MRPVCRPSVIKQRLWSDEELVLDQSLSSAPNLFNQVNDCICGDNVRIRCLSVNFLNVYLSRRKKENPLLTSEKMIPSHPRFDLLFWQAFSISLWSSARLQLIIVKMYGWVLSHPVHGYSSPRKSPRNTSQQKPDLTSCWGHMTPNWKPQVVIENAISITHLQLLKRPKNANKRGVLGYKYVKRYHWPVCLASINIVWMIRNFRPRITA